MTPRSNRQRSIRRYAFNVTVLWHNYPRHCVTAEKHPLTFSPPSIPMISKWKSRQKKKDSCTASFSTTTATATSFGNTTTCKWLLKKNPQSEPWSVPPLQLQNLIILEHIHIFYPVDLPSCLGHPDNTKMRWIWSTCLCIYATLDLAKNDFSHPVWSVVNASFLHKRPPCCWGTAIACFWNNFLSTVSLPVQRLPTEKPSFD